MLSTEVLIQFQSGGDQNTLSESLIQHIFRPYLRGSGLILGTKARQVSWTRVAGRIERVQSLEMSELVSQLPKWIVCF